MDETLALKPPATGRSQSERDLTKLLPQNSRATTAESMGRPYRTPSSAKEGYLSPSNVNSPSSSSQYSTEIEIAGSALAFTPTGSTTSQHQKQMATWLEAFCEDSYHQHYACSQETKKIDAFFAGDNAEELDEVEAPTTPTKKHVPVLWHGLPSPQTPGFTEYNPERHITCSSDDTIGSNIPEVPNDFIVDEIPLQDVSTNANQCLANDAKRALSDQTQTVMGGLSQSPSNTHDSFSDAGAITTKDKNGNDSEVMENDVERDAALARQLDERHNPTPMRRSARLRVKQKTDDISQPTLTAAWSTHKPHLDEELTAQPGVNIAGGKCDPISFEGLPIVHSTSWQLQYPPGGSTHPSYPYPTLDPRLIFHQQLVPIVDGLPDSSRVPKLALPMKWRHVSWSGLCPIVFDPYHQAFKLTPVGPLPLTCEELRQGGLHKHVPGGELHPEYGMIPEMLKLSDGSDAEVFDFDGVDWTLPWEGQLDFHAPSAPETWSSNASNGVTGSCTSNALGLESIYPWREARDCPDMIIDLDDGWRWLSTKETDPTADFIPTPGKNRHGTGVVRSTRKLKLPIPELMMLALQAEELPSPSTSTPNAILQNQDQPIRGKTHKIFCPLKSVATPANVNITLLGETEFTIVELLSFFPQHYYWHHASDRLHRAGVTPSFIRNMLCMTRALDDETAPKPSTISSAVSSARKRDVAKHGATEEVDIIDASRGMSSLSPLPTALPKSDMVEHVASYTAEGWTYDVWDKIDYPLLALAHGLQSLPSGVDAGPLTALILWCRENSRYRVLLSDVPVMLKVAGIEPLIEPGESECPDKEVMGRYVEALKKDRQRAKKSTAAGKRAMEEGGEGLTKRMKA